MRTSLLLLLLLLPIVTSTTTSNLPFNDINIVVVTDVHSWVASHRRHEPQWNADYGHVLSFYEHLLQQQNDQNILFVMNGDFTDGTGLSAYPPSQLTAILKNMPWDALTVGNHELYQNSTIAHITADGGFSDYWGSKYITSNVFRAESERPLGGSQWRIWEGPSATVLLFGFLYDMTANAGLVTITPVELAVQQDWFVDTLQDQQYDAIVCLVHMDYEDALIAVILNTIRSIVGDTVPVQFISGHSHIRAYAVVDSHSTSFEAGHYLDTVGFVSFDKEGTNFQHEFIEANVDVLQSVVGVDNLMTENGRQLQQMIRETQQEMGLLDNIGISPGRYYVYNGLSDSQSLWRMYMEKVINEFYFKGSTSVVFSQSNGAFRSDLFQGNITLDDIKSVDPFNNTIWKVTSALQGNDLLKVFGGKLNPPSPALPRYVCSTNNVESDKTYEFYTADYDLAYFVDRIQDVTGKKVEAVAQETATAKLWVDFVSSKWPEKEHSQPDPSPAASPFPFVGIGVVFAVALICIVLVTAARRRIVQGYNTVENAPVEVEAPVVRTGV